MTARKRCKTCGAGEDAARWFMGDRCDRCMRAWLDRAWACWIPVSVLAAVTMVWLGAMLVAVASRLAAG